MAKYINLSGFRKKQGGKDLEYMPKQKYPGLKPLKNIKKI